jgi:hypothetical protein
MAGAFLVVDFPEGWPERIEASQRDFGIARKHRSQVWPLSPGIHQACSLWIVKDVTDRILKRIGLSFAFPEDVIVCLWLQSHSTSTQKDTPVLTQKANRQSLIRSIPQAHPEKMSVIRHQAVAWTMKFVACHRMQ